MISRAGGVVRVSRSVRSLVVFLLALSLLSSGCIGVIPGYSCFGVPISQDERDDAEFPQLFFWEDGPEPPYESFNPGALVVNGFISILVDASFGIVVLWLLNLDDDEDQAEVGGGGGGHHSEKKKHRHEEREHEPSREVEAAKPPEKQ